MKRSALRMETLIVRWMEQGSYPVEQSVKVLNWKQNLHLPSCTLAPLPIHLQLGASFLIQNPEPSPRDAHDHVVNTAKWWWNVVNMDAKQPKRMGRNRKRTYLPPLPFCSQLPASHPSIHLHAVCKSASQANSCVISVWLCSCLEHACFDILTYFVCKSTGRCVQILFEVHLFRLHSTEQHQICSRI